MEQEEWNRRFELNKNYVGKWDMATILVSIIIIGCRMVSFVGNSTLTQHDCVQRNIQVDWQWHQESLNLQSPMERWTEPPLELPP